MDQKTPERPTIAWSIDAEEMKRQLAHENDALLVAVRGALYVENLLNNFLKEAVENADVLDSDRMGIMQKAQFVASMRAIPADFLPAIRKVSWLRNQYAHNLHFQVQESHRLDFFNSFPDYGKLVVRDAPELTGSSKEAEVTIARMIQTVIVLLDVFRHRFVEWKRERYNALVKASDILRALGRELTEEVEPSRETKEGS